MSNKWKPIDTAPKDGTAILACSKYSKTDVGLSNCPRTVRFSIYHPNSPGKGIWRNHLGHKENFLTHWKELDDPPN
jgi:hypothetical protein